MRVEMIIFHYICVLYIICMYMKLPKDKKKRKINKSLNSYDTVLISFGEGIELEDRH